jgi:hypothetical protein
MNETMTMESGKKLKMMLDSPEKIYCCPIKANRCASPIIKTPYMAISIRCLLLSVNRGFLIRNTIRRTRAATHWRMAAAQRGLAPSSRSILLNIQELPRNRTQSRKAP